MGKRPYTMPDRVPSQFALNLIEVALLAGREILDVYSGEIATAAKQDQSPVTEADTRAETVILTELAKLWPQIPVIAEEKAASGDIPETSEVFFLVDPLDGTREFISRNGEFTVNIARIENGVPTLGVVYAPALNQLWWGELNACAALAEVKTTDDPRHTNWRAIHVRSCPSAGATVLASRSHFDPATETYLKTVKVHELINAGSSLKFCRIAEAKADLYPRFGRTMEWDTAAGHAVLLAAGGKVLTTDGAPLTYGKRSAGFENPPFIATA
jgi:3'(2'), 5'-bisphosphate nucleotidase